MFKMKLFIFATTLILSIGVSAKETTEAGVCSTCASTTSSSYSVSGAFKALARYGEAAICYSQKLISAAKRVINSEYGGATRGRGNCARAVRQALQEAKIWQGGGMGNAKDMIGPMETAGYKNIFKPGMTPEQAPNGSILVYDEARVKSRCKGLGSVYGHVEIKENENSFLYDGKVDKNIHDIFEPECRPLIGVMVMGEECNTCSPSVKKACGEE